MDTYRAKITTAGLAAGSLYTADPDDDRIVALLNAGFIELVQSGTVTGDE